jgi:predicted NACHT family NTPase
MGRMPSGIRSVVDAGAGNLRDSMYFLSRGLEVTAVDWTTGLDVLDHDYSGADLAYARWLVHALDEAEEDRFLSLACRSKWLALECRSSNDKVPPKLAGHYRRLVDIVALRKKVEDNGMEIRHCRESRGWSVNGMDDPLLIRMIAERTKK